jgi:hypothetical protein
MKDLVDGRLILDTGDYLGFTSTLLATSPDCLHHTAKGLADNNSLSFE